MDIQALATRIERLETQNRRLRRIGGFFVLAAILGVTMGQAGEKKAKSKYGVIEARGLVLTNEKGERRAVFVAHKGRTILSFIDGETTHLSLETNKKGNALMINGKSRVMIGTTPFGAAVTLYDADATTRAAFALETEASFIRLMDKDGETILDLPGPATARPMR